MAQSYSNNSNIIKTVVTKSETITTTDAVTVQPAATDVFIPENQTGFCIT